MAIVDSQLGLGQQPTLVQSQSGLRAEGIGKSFNKRRVVRNVSIKLNRGEAVGLLGPNGAGKTTTFYMLAGLTPTDEGSVFIDGQDVTTLPIFQRARLGMGYLPQESSIFRGLTVEQNIRAVLETLDDSDDEFHAFTPCVVRRSVTGVRTCSKVRAKPLFGTIRPEKRAVHTNYCLIIGLLPIFYSIPAWQLRAGGPMPPPTDRCDGPAPQRSPSGCWPRSGRAWPLADGWDSSGRA